MPFEHFIVLQIVVQPERIQYIDQEEPMSQQRYPRKTLPAWKMVKLASSSPMKKKYSFQSYFKKNSLAQTTVGPTKVVQPTFLKMCEEMKDRDLIDNFQKDPIFMYRVKLIVDRVKKNKELLSRKGSKQRLDPNQKSMVTIKSLNSQQEQQWLNFYLRCVEKLKLIQ